MPKLLQSKLALTYNLENIISVGAETLFCAWLYPQYLEGVLREKYVLSKSMNDSMDVSLLDLGCCRLILCLMLP